MSANDIDQTQYMDFNSVEVYDTYDEWFRAKLKGAIQEVEAEYRALHPKPLTLGQRVKRALSNLNPFT